MPDIHVVPEELTRMARRLDSVQSTLNPISPHTALGDRVYGFPVLSRAMAAFAASVDRSIEEVAKRMVEVEAGLDGAVNDFVAYEDSTQTLVEALQRKI